MKKICVFASGTGTNTENIIRYFQHHPDGVVSLVVSNQPTAGVVDRARNLGVPVCICTRQELESPQGLTLTLQKAGIDLIVLAGFLRLIPPALLSAFPNQIINIHPSLLPKYGGKGMYGMKVHHAVIEAGETESGITIHTVNEHYDKGAILLQKSCPILPGDTPDDLAKKIHALEHLYYPVLIESLIKSR